MAKLSPFSPQLQRDAQLKLQQNMMNRQSSKRPIRRPQHRELVPRLNVNLRPMPKWYNYIGAVGNMLTLGGMSGAAGLALRSEAQLQESMIGDPIKEYTNWMYDNANRMDKVSEWAMGLGDIHQEKANEQVFMGVGKFFNYIHEKLAGAVKATAPTASTPEEQERIDKFSEGISGGVMFAAPFLIRRGTKKGDVEKSVRDMMNDPRIFHGRGPGEGMGPQGGTMVTPNTARFRTGLDLSPKPKGKRPPSIPPPGYGTQPPAEWNPYQPVPYEVFFDHVYKKAHKFAEKGSKRSRREYDRYLKEVEGFNDARLRYLEQQETKSQALREEAFEDYYIDTMRRLTDEQISPEMAWTRMEREQALSYLKEQELAWSGKEAAQTLEMRAKELHRWTGNEAGAGGRVPELRPYTGIPLSQSKKFSKERGGAPINPEYEAYNLEPAILDPSTRKVYVNPTGKGTHGQIYNAHERDLGMWNLSTLEQKGYLGFKGPSGQYYTREQALKMRERIDPKVSQDIMGEAGFLESNELFASRQRLKDKIWMKGRGKASKQRGGPGIRPGYTPMRLTSSEKGYITRQAVDSSYDVKVEFPNRPIRKKKPPRIPTKRGRRLPGPKKKKPTEKIPFLQEGDPVIQNTIRDIGADITGMKSITQPRRVASEIKKRTGNEDLHLLLDTLEAPERFIRPGQDAMSWFRKWDKRLNVPASYTEGIRVVGGKFRDQLDNIFTQFGRRVAALPRRVASMGRMLPKKKNTELFRDLTRNQVPRTPMGTAIREWLDAIYRYAETNGLNPREYLKGYWPVVFDTRKVNKNLTAFRQLLHEYGITPEKAEQIIDSINHKAGMVELPKWQTAMTARGALPRRYRLQKNLEVERTVFKKIPTEKLEPFMELDTFKALNKYLTATVARVEAARRWGPKDEKFVQMMRQAAISAKEAGRPLTQAELKRLFTLKDTLQHMQYTMPHKWHRGMKAFLTWQVLNKLIFAGVHSIPEIARMATAPGMKQAFLKAAIKSGWDIPKQFIRHFIYRGPNGHVLGPSSARFWAHQIDKARSVMTMEQQAALWGGDIGTPLQQSFFVMNGQIQWLNMTNILASNTFKDSAIAYANYMLGKKGAKVIHPLWWKGPWRNKFERDLRYYGIDPAKLIDWVREGRPANHPFVETQLKLGMIRFVHDTVITPRSTVLPQHFSHPIAAPLFQLLKFPALFGNTPMKRMMMEAVGEAGQRMGWLTASTEGLNALATLGVGFVLADMALKLSDYVKYGDFDSHPVEKKSKGKWTLEKIGRRMERFGFGGLAMERPKAMMEAPRYGKGPLLSGFGGPALGDMDQLVRALIAQWSSKNPNPRQLSRWIVEKMLPASSALARDRRAPGIPGFASKEDAVDYVEKFLIKEMGFTKKSAKRRKSMY